MFGVRFFEKQKFVLEDDDESCIVVNDANVCRIEFCITSRKKYLFAPWRTFWDQWAKKASNK
jgi:hypothetical protein